MQKELSLAMAHGSMHMESNICLAMTHESMHAVGVRIYTLMEHYPCTQ